MVDEEAAEVVLVLVLLHQLEHLLVLWVSLEEGVGTRHSPLQVVQLDTDISSADVKARDTESLHRVKMKWRRI